MNAQAQTPSIQPTKDHEQDDTNDLELMQRQFDELEERESVQRLRHRVARVAYHAH